MITNNFENFVNIGVVCEGQTETDFIKRLNREYFNQIKISLKPIGIEPNKNLEGNISIDRVVSFLYRSSSNFPILTTFIDFYGMKDKDNKTVDELEKELEDKFNRNNKYSRIFIPYIQMHETEALWFSDINAIVKVKNATILQIDKLNEINMKYSNPEDINNSYESAPSKRLKNIFSDYNKVIDGRLISDKISLDVLKIKCPRFKEWINRITALRPIS